MRRPAVLLSVSVAVLLCAAVRAQNPVEIEFQSDPVLVQTGADIVFTVLTVPQVVSITWDYQGGVNLGVWSGGTAQVNTAPQFQGRVTITATQLRIRTATLQDAGAYTVTVIPIGTSLENAKSAQLRVFEAIAGLSLVVPSVSLEDRNVSLSCTWTAGTEVAVQWGKDGSTVTADSRIAISGGSLVIDPARRGDAGEYTCTASNPVSARTATQSLTVFYGPDAPVLTLDAPKDCVGGGDVMVGQTVRFTCTSSSLPPALFSWQRDGQAVSASQPDSGVLSLQTFSTNQSGRFVCTARNAVSGGTSEQARDLSVVDVCLSGGEVAGIVIGAFLALLIIILLIVLIICLVRRRRRRQRRRDTVLVPKTNPTPRIIPPDPQPTGVRELNQGPNPPLFYTRQADRLNAASRGSRANPQTLALNGLHNSDTHQHNGQAHTNGLLHNAIQNTNSYPHNGIDNPAFTRTAAPNANTLPNTQQQNPNVLIQTGAVQGGAQPPAVQVSLQTLPQTSQPNNAQMPTINVNLNSYPTGQTQQDSSAPPAASQSQRTQTHTGPIDPAGLGGLSFPGDPRVNGDVNRGQAGPGLIPTGYTHYNGDAVPQRNANTHAYQQDPDPHRRADRNPERQDATPSSSRRQMPWDRLRGTPSYPRETPRRADVRSDSTDYTSHPPIREARPPNRSQPRSQTASRTRSPPRRDASSPERGIWNRLADLRRANASSAAAQQLEPSQRSQRGSDTQRERAQPDIRDLPVSQTASRQEATRSNNPQALPLVSQQAPAGRSAVSQGPATQQGLTAPQGADTRALADPNHLQQAHRAALIQTLPHGLGTQTQPVMHAASRPRQGGAGPVPPPPAQTQASPLTPAALRAHTAKAQVFKDRQQQTQSALLHPGTQTRAAAGGAQQPPPPPPAIPLAQFQSLPRERVRQLSPNRGPQPLRAPANVPVAPRQRANEHRHRSNHHQHATNGHRHVHGQPGHSNHPRPQQAHRGRPR